MKPRNVAIKYGRKTGRTWAPQIALGAALATASLGSFAAEFDTTESLGWIAAGVVAGGIILAATFGLVTMIGAGKKAQRAGT